MTSQTIHRSFMMPRDPDTGNIGDNPASEHLPLEHKTEEDDQVFQLPRMRSLEGAHAVQITIPQEISIDFGSEFDSRPSSELKDVESRPTSTGKCSLSSTPEKEPCSTKFSRRAFSIDETVSDSLKVNEPFARPVSPLPEKQRLQSTDSDDCKLKVRVNASARATSPVQKANETDESIEADIAFSKHFTQVLDEDEDSSEIIKTTEGQPLFPNKMADLTPDSQNIVENFGCLFYSLIINLPQY